MNQGMKNWIIPTIGFLAIVRCACAWDYEGHRLVNQLALAALPTNFPVFVKEPAAAERITFLSGEPDRWRNTTDLTLKHFNNPDHYIDFEDVAACGLKPETLPPFRYDFTKLVARAHATDTIDSAKDPDHTKTLIGYLPWTIAEYYGKLKSSFSYLKAFEEAGTPEEIKNARENIIYIMGCMGHFVGDGSQPLHTTIHFNGWVGDNPNGYEQQTAGRLTVAGQSPAKSFNHSSHRIQTEEPQPALRNKAARIGYRRSKHPNLNQERNHITNVAINRVQRRKP